MPKCFQLVGIPGSGKTTWVAAQPWAADCVVVSTDHWVELEAARLGLTYSEAFDAAMPGAIANMMSQVRAARKAGLDIIWDQTSVSVGSRRKKFKALPEYDHIAVVFSSPDPSELNRRLNSRPGKIIPQSVIERMASDFVMPSVEFEGFVEVRIVG